MAASSKKDRAALLSGLISQAKRQRAQYEPKWYVSYNAYENNHFVVWLPESKRIMKVPMKGNKFFNQIPEITKQVDTIENMILAVDIVPVVYPVKDDDVSNYWAERISDYLLYLYKHWMFNGVLHDGVHDALVMPCSYLQLLPPATNDGKMDIVELDAFDVFHTPGIKDVQSPECNYIGKSIWQDVDQVKRNDQYNGNRKKVTGEQRTSSSVYKDMIHQERYGQNGDTEGGKRTCVDELWIKEAQDDGKVKIRVITLCEDMILRDELTDYDRFPFVSLKLHGGPLYRPSFVEYLLPINRSIDLFQSRMEDAGLKAVKATLMAQEGSNVTRTTNENGEILWYRGTPPQWQPPVEIPPFFLNYLNLNFSWMERYGASAITMGASPKGVKTYRAAEAMRQQDYAGMKTSMDFMKIALTQLFNLVIYFASMYYLEPVGIKVYQQDEYDTFRVLGAKGLKHNMDEFEQANQAQVAQLQAQAQQLTQQPAAPLQPGQPTPPALPKPGEPTLAMKKAPVVIHQDNVVEVEFEQALSYTMEGKRQTIMELYQAGLLAAEDAIRMMKIGNVRDLMDNLKKQQQDQVQMQAAVPQAAPGAAPGAPQPGQPMTPQPMLPPKPLLPPTPAQPAPASQLPGIRVGQ